MKIYYDESCENDAIDVKMKIMNTLKIMIMMTHKNVKHMNMKK